MKTLPNNRDPFTIRLHELNLFRKDLQHRIDKDNELALGQDMDLLNMVQEDIYTVLGTCPEGDIYKAEMPVVQVVRDKDSIRVYGLEVAGGIALVYKKGKNTDEFNLFTLGEDDGSYFPKSRRLYEPMQAYAKYNASTFVNLLSQVLALFNSIEK